MADYLPIFKPGATVTMTAGAAIIGGRAVELSGDRTVQHAAAGSPKYVGVAGFSAAAGEKVTVHTPGQGQRGIASGAVTAGDMIKAAAGGKVATGATQADKIGIALTGGSDGETIQYLD